MDLAELGREVAAFHLSIRRVQVASGENDFPDILDSQADLTDLEGYYLRPGGNFWTQWSAGHLTGCVGLRNVGDGVGQVKRLAVHPDYRRRGIAEDLMRELVDWARRIGFERLDLLTGAREHARGVYRRVGFITDPFAPIVPDRTMRQWLRPEFDQCRMTR